MHRFKNVAPLTLTLYLDLRRNAHWVLIFVVFTDVRRAEGRGWDRWCGGGHGWRRWSFARDYDGRACAGIGGGVEYCGSGRRWERLWYSTDCDQWGHHGRGRRNERRGKREYMSLLFVGLGSVERRTRGRTRNT
jgi:hypothetical protein